MNDEMYGGPISPESSFGQGAEIAMEQLNQMLRLQQARRAEALSEIMASQGMDSSLGIAPWRLKNSGFQKLGPFSLRAPSYEANMPMANSQLIENTFMPDEYRALIRPGRFRDPTEDYNVRQYLIDAIMNAITRGRPDRSPELLPQPTRGNMYGRFPGRE